MVSLAPGICSANNTMPQPDPANPVCSKATRQRFGRAVAVAGGVGFFALLGWTTVQAFEQDTQPPALAALETAQRPGVAWPTAERESESRASGGAGILPAEHADSEPIQPDSTQEVTSVTPPRAADPRIAHPSQTRDAMLLVDGEVWTGPTFDGRPIRPVRTVTMTTTAYSPDEKSCGVWADGITASGMSVWTNGMKLAAADPSIPFGTILTVPGYNDNHPIPVLDRGGAIKGNRLDLLYPTHDIALQWGVQDLEVVVWEYADE